MNKVLLRTYHALPYPLKCSAASLWGYHLRALRYDRQTERLVQEAHERESWSGEKWGHWQEERLAYILQRAATKVPYYRDYWTRKYSGDPRAWQKLENWPVLTKESLRRNPRAFIAEDCNPSSMYEEHTGGTTGIPLKVWWSYKTVKAWYALFEARWRRWYDVSLTDRWAIIGGQLIVPVSRREPPYWVWNEGLRQLYLSAYHLSASSVPDYVRAMARHNPVYLLGYTSSLFFLAQQILIQKMSPPKLRVVLTNAEPVTAEQKKIMEEAFQCSVRETYGMAEIAAAASECDKRKLHLWPECGHVEIDAGHFKEEAGRTGKLICTGLINGDMPLIRYDAGDSGTLEDPDVQCSCGRSLPMIRALHGRNHDQLTTPEGRPVWYFNPAFYDLPVQEAQVIQEASDLIRVLVVSARPLDEDENKKIADRVRERIGGGVKITVESVAAIPRENNGKFRAVISRLSCKPIAGD